MTHERDIDRLLDLWLLDGPTEVADRVVIDVADRIDRQPQRPAWRFLRRPPLMTSSARWAAALVAACLIAVVGFAVLGRPSDAGVGGEPTPTPTAGSSIPASAAAFLGDFVGAPRSLPGIDPRGNDRAYLSIDLVASGTYLNFFSGDTSTAGSGAVLLSNPIAFEAAGDRFSVRAVDRTLGCEPGVVGAYGWTVSPGETALTLTALDDPCEGRRLALAGDWTRTTCDANQLYLCLGDVAAGTYRTAMFQPLRASAPDALDPEGYVGADYAQLAFTVPDGWSNPLDSPERLTLTLGDDQGIDFLARAAADIEAGCVGAGAPADDSAAALVDWVSRHPGVVAGTPADIVIDGHPGRMVDMKFRQDWKVACPGTADRPGTSSLEVPLLADAGGRDPIGTSLPMWERWRLIALDLGDGITTAIIIRGQAVGSLFEEFAAEAMPVVESLDYR